MSGTERRVSSRLGDHILSHYDHTVRTIPRTAFNQIRPKARPSRSDWPWRVETRYDARWAAIAFIRSTPTWEIEMIELIKKMRADGDSVGGVIECVIRGVPAGLGEPVFDKLEADLAKAMMSLPATKGFEIGSGFAGTLLTGSQHNDPFEMREGVVHTRTNLSGGIQGGISNGEPIFFRIAFKPTATIARKQQTVTVTGEETEIAARGRHDPCVLPRAVPMVEAMAALVLCDHTLRQRGQVGM